MKRFLLSLSTWSTLLFGQTLPELTVNLESQDGERIPNARVTLTNPLSGFEKPLVATSLGTYQLKGIPAGLYQGSIQASGFLPMTFEAALRSQVPLTMDFTMQLSGVSSSVQVSASDAGLVDPAATGTRSALTAERMEKLPVPLGSRGLEARLLTFPGFAMNANGAIHPRGAHNQMTFVIDGLPVNDQLTGAFATALDPSIVESLELYTGDVPAEFGAKVSGVAVISTRSGASGGPFRAQTESSAGSFDTLQQAAQAGGASGRLAYFGAVSAVRTHRFLDQVSFDNLHNGGNSGRAFLRLDYQASSRDQLRFNAMAGRSSFELANLRSQQAAAMDQRQLLHDASFWLHWSRILSPLSTWETTVAYRPAIAQLLPSPRDTPVTAAQARHLNTVTITNRWNRLHRTHSIRAGIDLQHFRLSEDFTLAITDPSFNASGARGFNDALSAYDLTRGGRPFAFSGKGAGTLYSAFVQDSVIAGSFVLSLGLRYDAYRFLVQGVQVQPRLGVAYHLKETGTVFRASYNRNYQTPPNENLLLSSSEAAGRLAPARVRAALDDTVVPLRAQRENVYEAGVQQALWGKAGLNASVYHKDSRDQQDNNNFFNSGIIFPVTLASIRVNGAEARLVLPDIHGVTATVSATHAHAVSTPPFTGGLYLGQDAVDLLSSGPFVIDHDQRLSLQATVQYTINRSWWASTSIRYDSGLVANPSDPAVVARDPDYADQLPYVDLAHTPARVNPRTVTDLAFAHQHWRGERRLWDVQVQLNNTFGSRALYNFQSVFVGTRIVAPRSMAVKLRLYW